MIKRVNFTGRRRVPRERLEIEVYPGEPRTFDATFNFAELDLLDHAAVILEATCAGSSVVRRFEFGEVCAIVPPTDRQLSDLNGENVFFTLKVVDQTERFGRIVGLAENIRPTKGELQESTGRQGILPVEPYELGSELWKLEFRDHHVFLLVNKEIPALADCADPLFYTVIYPAVVTRILERALNEGTDVEEEENDRWPAMWLRFGQQIHPEREKPPISEDDEARAEWVDEVTRAFCERHNFRDIYVSAQANSSDLGGLL